MLDFAIERGANMSRKLPVDTVLAFLEQINARNVDGLCALMTEDHVFVDGLGNRMQGREVMRNGWAGYFRMFPDYRVSHTDIFSEGDVVAAFGSAEGTLAVKEELPKENHWSVPAAWRAVVRDGLIAEWQVYADNQSARKIMGMQNP
jgi:ketosteroid isomerase-like protein